MSATYEARAHGVESGQLVVRARRLCPELVVVAPDLDDYAFVSANVMAILGSMARRVEPVSMDEAYLDLNPPSGWLQAVSVLRLCSAATLAMAWSIAWPRRRHGRGIRWSLRRAMVCSAVARRSRRRRWSVADDAAVGSASG
jgi:nucleotidyltransferase/DNA polymerase involved in DNA repair